MRTLGIAFNLLTILPLPASKAWQAGDSGRAAGWYSFVGLCLGGIVAALVSLLGLYFSQTVTAAISLAAWIALTGGLHLDGLADCFDGMFHASNPERRLQIMRDPHVGSFGAIGLVLVLLVKFSALASLPHTRAVGAILLAASLARWCVTLAGTQPLARPDGMGADFAMGLKKSSLFLGALMPAALGIWLGIAGGLAIAFGLLVIFVILYLARKNLGGVTGDVFGMIVEIVEVGTLLMVGLRW
ncbi:MAG: adenosylcobinamide-GDP ribazoletransferase [Chloroflexi bacterium]|nr:adenosylcobinamide-GDP ribazoletransferase [Chloroflexota bacterium]